MFGILKFTQAKYYGKAENTDFVADWPVSPMRSISALYCSYFENFRDSPSHKAALEALESAAPPRIYYHSDFERCQFQTYVPTLVDHELRAMNFPSVNLRNPCVFYKWNLSNEYVKLLDELARRVSYVGTSDSTVMFNFAESVEIPDGFDCLKPVPVSNFRLKVPYQGRLELSEDYFTKEDKPNPKFQYYRKAIEKVKTAKYYSDFLVFKIFGSNALHLKFNAEITSKVHEALVRIMSDSGMECSLLTNYGQNPHLSQMILPFVGQHGSGIVYGIGLAIPKSASENDREKCYQIMSKLNHLMLFNREYKLEVVNETENTPITLRKHTWVGPSKKWATVIPAEINWRVDNFKWVCELCHRMNLPVPLDVRWQKQPCFHGSWYSSDHQSRNEYVGYKSGCKLHFYIEFSENVEGPLLLGKDFNFGGGLFKPIIQ